MFLVLISLNDVYFILIQNLHFLKLIKVLSIIANPMAPPFQKVCGNYCLIDIIISPTGDVYSNACCSKSKVVKFEFMCATIITSEEPMLLTIKGKWLEAIVHMCLCFWLYLIRNKLNSSFPFGFIINFIDRLHLPLLVFTKIMNNFCRKWNLVCVVEIWL
jgi:hypothetical protein